jgi:hypothetical protein
MDRKAADNKYLHRDFHVSTDNGLLYIGTHYGDKGIREYLEQFSRSWYAPLAAAVRKDGLGAMKAHIEKIYETEEATDVLHISLKGEELSVSVDRCPAVTYMRSIGYTPSRWYKELTSTVNRIVADMAGIGFEMLSYDETSGKAAYRFYETGRRS